MKIENVLVQRRGITKQDEVNVFVYRAKVNGVSISTSLETLHFFVSVVCFSLVLSALRVTIFSLTDSLPAGPRIAKCEREGRERETGKRKVAIV